jgi:hypothetical protein
MPRRIIESYLSLTDIIIIMRDILMPGREAAAPVIEAKEWLEKVISAELLRLNMNPIALMESRLSETDNQLGIFVYGGPPGDGPRLYLQFVASECSGEPLFPHRGELGVVGEGAFHNIYDLDRQKETLDAIAEAVAAARKAKEQPVSAQG